jgi:hypothetical protein
MGGGQACLTRGLRDQAFLIARLKLAGEMLLKPLFPYEVKAVVAEGAGMRCLS